MSLYETDPLTLHPRTILGFNELQRVLAIDLLEHCILLKYKDILVGKKTESKIESMSFDYIVLSPSPSVQFYS